MSRPPLVVLPRGAAEPVADRLQFARSADAPESFDVLACGNAAEEALQAALSRPGSVRALVLAAAAPPADATLLERFAALKIPTLALFGTRDADVPPETGRRWRALLPGCHIVLLYDAGHDLAADRPDALVDVVLDFLSDPAAFLVNRRSGVLHA
jgi:pimeloyl-ACP methyl ester carboxylesterase